MPDFLPYSRQTIEDDDVAAVAAALRGDYLTTGPTIAAFEQALAQRVGSRFAVACANGTAALHLAAMAAGLGEGGGAIVPTLTFLATANAARYVGAEVTFADVSASDGLMGHEHLTQALARCPQPPQVIFNVHLNGQCADPQAIAEIAGKSGAVVIEDACHALGTTYRSADGTTQEIGSCRHSLMAVFSFHAVKAMTMGEGGAITTNDPQTYERLRLLRSHGMTREAGDFQHTMLAFDHGGQPNPWYYEMSEMGYNYRATDFQCALGLSQLKKLERLNGRRRALAATYDRLFAGFSNFVRPIDRHPSCNPIWHLYVVHIDFAAIGRSRAEVMRRLTAAGIGTQVHYLPVHRQPYYVNRYGALTLSGADHYYEACLSLPFFPSMSDDDPARVVSALQDAIHGRPA